MDNLYNRLFFDLRKSRQKTKFSEEPFKRKISHFLIETAKHAWIVWMDSAIESTSHETWNG